MLARINRGYAPAYWDDFFNDSFFNGLRSLNNGRGYTPAVNILEDDTEFRIEVAVPGMSKKDFRIDVEDDILTVSSEQKDSKEEKDRRYMRREFSHAAFRRSFELPETVDQEKIKARHDAGILNIVLPKKEEIVQKTNRQIEIK